MYKTFTRSILNTLRKYLTSFFSFTAVLDYLSDPIANGKIRATQAPFPGVRTAELVPSLNCRRTLNPVSRVSVR